MTRHRLTAPLLLAGSVFTGEERSSQVVIHADFEAPKLVERLHSAVVSAIPHFEEAIGYRLPESERLVIHLFGRVEAYQSAIREVGVGSSFRNPAVTAGSNPFE